MDKTYSRYGDLLDKAMKKKEDRMLASAMRIRDNINAENKRKEQEKFRRELKKESDQIEEQNRQQETLDFANAMLDRYKQRREEERKRKEAEDGCRYLSYKRDVIKINVTRKLCSGSPDELVSLINFFSIFLKRKGCIYNK